MSLSNDDLINTKLNLASFIINMKSPSIERQFLIRKSNNGPSSS